MILKSNFLIPLLRGAQPRPQLFHHALRPLSSSAPRQIKQMPPRPKLDESDITGTYLKGTGPGGQKINKTSSAVQLIHMPTNTVVKCQATRSRSQNRKIAHQLLAEKIELMEKGEKSRAAIVGDVKKRKKASKGKKSRRKYKALEEEKKAAKENMAEGEKEDGVEDGDGVEGGMTKEL